MGLAFSRYTKYEDDNGSSKRFATRVCRVASSSSSSSSSRIIRRNLNSNNKMTSISSSKKSPMLTCDTTQQATLVSGETDDVTMQNKMTPLGNVSVSNDDMTMVTTKQPIDPPGALWSSTEATNFGHPTFQHPGGFPMWGPSHHPGDSSGNRSHWSMPLPPFLAPLAATVRHPFSHFVPNGQGYFPYWQQQQQQHYHQRGDGGGIDTQREADVETIISASTSTDITMKNEDASSDQSIEVSVIQPTVTLPSTFAPQEYVDKIRAKANAGREVNVIQTRSMTAKSRSTTSLKQKVSPIVAAHQASSPPSGSKGNGIDLSKSTAVGNNPTPEVMTILGHRVHMIDAERKVFVIDLLSPETCDEIRMMADNHTRTAKEGAETWRTLYTYTKMDLPVVEVKDMVSKYTEKILHDVKKIVGVVFGRRREAMRLRPRSWKEPHLLLYQALDDRPHHTGIEMHYDGCDVTWQAMLTRLDEYEGGGTYFRSLRKTIKLKQGQVLVHPGELYHKGLDITYGVRCLLVCFTDGMNPSILDDSKQEDDDPKYESSVIIC